MFIKYYLTYFIILIASLGSYCLQANPFDHRVAKAFRVQNLSIDDGLSQSVVTYIIQDSDGYIWAATGDGVNRYNGYDFDVFQNVHSDKNSLHENSTTYLLEDPEHGIWIGTANGLSFLDLSTKQFTSYSSGKVDRLATIYSLAHASEKHLFIGSENGLFILDKTTSEISPFISQSGEIIDDEVRAFVRNDNQIWVASSSCLYSIQPDNFAMERYCDGPLAPMFNNGVAKAIVYTNGSLWLGKTDGLYHLNLSDLKWKHFRHQEDNPDAISSNWVQSLALGNNNDLWIGTTHGLDLLDLSELTITHYNYKVYDSDGLSSDDIISLHVDKTGIVWVGTHASGIDILAPEKNRFEHILTRSDLAKFNVGNSAFGIVKDREENIWVATFGSGLIKFDLMTGDASLPYREELAEIKERSDHIYSLTIDTEELLWIGMLSGVAILDLATEELFATKIFVQGKEIYFDYLIHRIYEDHSGKLWLAADSGLYQVQQLVKKSGYMEVHVIDKQRELPYSFRDRSSAVTSFLQTRDGSYWAGGNTGLLKYSSQKKKWIHFEYEADNPQSISNDYVNVIFEDSRGILWVGTANGLNKVHRDNEDEIYFERITKEQGLPSNSIYEILEDRQKQIWISTTSSLVRYSEYNEVMQTFRRDDGLSSNEFNFGSAFIDNEGLLYFGSINGITVVDSRYHSKIEKHTDLKLTEVIVGQRKLDVYELNHMKAPVIEKYDDETTVKISVAELYYRKLGTQSYRYRVLGLEDKWIYLGSERSFVLGGLSEGKYLLDIQSKVGNGEWSSKTLRLKLQVYTDFWRGQNAIYLIGFCSIVLAFIIFSLIKRHFLRQVHKVENRLKMETIRLKDVKKQSDELKMELDEKQGMINVMTEEIETSSKKLESHSFREPVTGFYRFQSIANMLSEDIAENGLPFSFNLVMAIQLCDFESIREKYGAICAAEISSYVAIELRKMTPASLHICSLNNDSFVVIGNSIQHKNLSSILFSVRDKVERSQIAIANDIFVQTRVAMSYFEIYPDKIGNLKDLTHLAELLIALHSENNPVDLAALMRVDLNKPIDGYTRNSKHSKNDEVNWAKGLVESNSVTLHFL